MSTLIPSGYLVQMTSERNPPHGWAVHLLRGEQVDGAIPFYLDSAVESLRKECDRAWREVDFIAKERTEHLEWRTKLANDLDECERMRDALGVQLNKYHAVYAAANALMARLGHDGTIDTNSPLVETLMNALDEVGGTQKEWIMKRPDWKGALAVYDRAPFEAADEIERLNRLVDSLRAERDALACECKQLRADAERYRWWAQNPYTNFQTAWRLWDGETPWSTAVDAAKDKP